MESVAMIIPMYNKVQCVAQTLQSVLDKIQYKNFECIIIDDESTDGSSDIAIQFTKAHPNRFRYIRVLNSGVSRARNFGVQCTDADYVCFLDADDEVYSDYVTRGIEAYNTHDIDLYLENSKIRYVDDFTDYINKSICETVGDRIIMSGKDYCIKCNIVPHFCGGLYKRDMVLRYDFLENVHIEDYIFLQHYIYRSKNIYVNLKDNAIIYNEIYSERHKSNDFVENQWVEYYCNKLNELTDNKYPIYVEYYQPDEDGSLYWIIKNR
jgi:glycosyltransferase involved in cell wall biosynthesis